jgi:NRAMP (natural resistance-associated macrophage protein)-like metal ion transporter
MYWISKSIHRVVRLLRRTLLFLAAMGPGIITMVADNDAGGISTYAQTGAKTGFNLLWAFLILVPMAYYVQEMTVRLGAVTKRGHAEAIFDGFGKFWGWFSIFDLALINWLTLVTEYIGMTQAMRLFNIPEWITFLSVTLLLLGIVSPVGIGRLRKLRFSSASLILFIFRQRSGPCTPETSPGVGRQSVKVSLTLTSTSTAPSRR